MAIKKLSPFKLWTLQNFPFIAEDFDALTNYEMMCKIVGYLNDVIDVTNNQTTAINELLTWFDNLDVQDEINKKLDEMAEDGTISRLFAQYVDPRLNAQDQLLNSRLNSQDLLLNNRLDSQDSLINVINNKVDNVASGSPLVANSLSDMTDTTRTYVLTTNGYWYYYDGASWVQGGIYQAAENSDNVDDNTIAIGDDYKLSNSILTDSGHFLKVDGSLGSANAFSTSDFIKINGGDKIEIVTCSSSTGLIVAYYDYTHAFISGVSSASPVTRANPLITTAPSNASYYKVSNNIVSNNLNGSVRLSSIVKNLVTDTYNNEYRNNKKYLIFNQSDLTNIGFIDNQGVSQPTVTTYSYSDYIRCDNIRNLIIEKASRNTGFTISYYTGDKTLISGVSLNNAIVTPTNYNVPTNASYLRFSSNNTFDFKVIANIYNSLENKLSSASDIASDILFSSKIALVGDSLTAGQGSTGYVSYSEVIDGVTYSIRGNGPNYPSAGADYQVGEFLFELNNRKWYEPLDGNGWGQKLVNYLKVKYPNSTVTNFGMAGINSYNLSSFMPNLVNDYDIIILMIGTNDRAYENLDNTYNSIYNCVNTLLNNNKKVILIAPPPATLENETLSTYYFHMEDIRHLYSRLSRQLSVPLIDCFDYIKEYINYKNIQLSSLTSSDGLHYNDIGYDVLFKHICSELGLSYPIDGATWLN